MVSSSLPPPPKPWWAVVATDLESHVPQLGLPGWGCLRCLLLQLIYVSANEGHKSKDKLLCVRNKALCIFWHFSENIFKKAHLTSTKGLHLWLSENVIAGAHDLGGKTFPTVGPAPHSAKTSEVTGAVYSSVSHCRGTISGRWLHPQRQPGLCVGWRCRGGLHVGCGRLGFTPWCHYLLNVSEPPFPWNPRLMTPVCLVGEW